MQVGLYVSCGLQFSCDIDVGDTCGGTCGGGGLMVRRLRGVRIGCGRDPGVLFDCQVVILEVAFCRWVKRDDVESPFASGILDSRKWRINTGLQRHDCRQVRIACSSFATPWVVSPVVNASSRS